MKLDLKDIDMMLLHRKYFQTENLQKIVSDIFFNHLNERSKGEMLQQIKKRYPSEIVQVGIDNPYLKEYPEISLEYDRFNPIYIRMECKSIEFKQSL